MESRWNQGGGNCFKWLGRMITESIEIEYSINRWRGGDWYRMGCKRDTGRRFRREMIHINRWGRQFIRHI